MQKTLSVSVGEKGFGSNFEQSVQVGRIIWLGRKNEKDLDSKAPVLHLPRSLCGMLDASAAQLHNASCGCSQVLTAVVKLEPNPAAFLHRGRLWPSSLLFMSTGPHTLHASQEKYDSCLH